MKFLIPAILNTVKKICYSGDKISINDGYLCVYFSNYIYLLSLNNALEPELIARTNSFDYYRGAAFGDSVLIIIDTPGSYEPNRVKIFGLPG